MVSMLIFDLENWLNIVSSISKYRYFGSYRPALLVWRLEDGSVQSDFNTIWTVAALSY